MTVASDESKHFAGFADGEDPKKFSPTSRVAELPGKISETGSMGPIKYLATVQNSVMQFWSSEKFSTPAGQTTAYIPRTAAGTKLLTPGGSPTFKGVRSPKFTDKLDFISLMLALFGGTASLPHILIRYYTVKDQAAARKSTVTGIAAIGFFYVLTLYLGLGAMTSGSLDVTVAANSNLAAPLLAKTYGRFLFAVISAIAFTTVLGTVSGLIMAASGAVAHDIMTNIMKIQMDDRDKVRAGKIAAVFVGGAAMVLGIVFKDLNAGFLVGWAFNVAASANLPALIMLLFWRRTTKQGITAAITVGLLSSLIWLLLSAPAYQYVYKLPPANAIVPFSQPGIVTIPLGFAVLVVVSLLTPLPVLRSEEFSGRITESRFAAVGVVRVIGLIVGYPTSYFFQPGALRAKLSLTQYVQHISDVFNSKDLVGTAIGVWIGCVIIFSLLGLMLSLAANSRRDSKP